MKTWSIAIVGVIALSLAGARTASADPLPPELGVGSIELVPVTQPGFGGFRKVDYVSIRLYCGGMYGGSYPAGRTATVEMYQAGKPMQVIHTRTLPEISSKTGYSFVVRVPGDHFTTTTTIRVRLSGGDANPSNDVLSRTFYQYTFNFYRNSVLRQRSDVQMVGKVKNFP